MQITMPVARKIIKETAPNIIQDNINNILPPEKLTEKNPNVIEATLEIREMVQKLQKLERQKKRISADEDRLKSQVMNYMQLHALLCFKGSIIATWKTHSSTSFNLAGFKTELPHFYPSYLHEVTVRNFRIM